MYAKLKAPFAKNEPIIDTGTAVDGNTTPSVKLTATAVSKKIHAERRPSLGWSINLAQRKLEGKRTAPIKSSLT